MTETKLRSLTGSESDSVTKLLTHIGLPGGGSIEIAKPATSSGGGKFDEAQVKRDNNGKFSSKAGGSNPKDQEWLNPKNIKALTQQLLFNHGDEIQPAMDAIMKKFGLPSTDFRKSPKAGHEALITAAKILNNFAATETSSPSGDLQLEFGPNDSGTNLEGKVVPRKNLSHDAASTIENFLAHFGRKGMKWGQHVFTSSRGSSATTLLKPKSGEPDDITAIKQKLSSSGFHSLSNNEMSTLVNRLNLQANYAKLTTQPGKVEKGRKFVDNQLKTGKSFNDAIAFANSPAGQLLASTFRSSSRGRHAGAPSTVKDLLAAGGHKKR